MSPTLHLEGNTEFPLQLNRSSESPVANQQQSRIFHCKSRGNLSSLCNLRGGPTPLLQLQRNPEIPVSRGKQRFPLQHESNPEFPVTTRVELQVACCNSREGPTPKHEVRPNCHAATREEHQGHTCNSRGGLYPLLQLERKPVIPVDSGEEAQVPRHNLRGGLTVLLQLERSPEFPAASCEEPCNSRGGLTPLL